MVPLNIQGSYSQLFLPPPVDLAPVIEPLSDPFVDEFEFGGIHQVEPSHLSETYVDHRQVDMITSASTSASKR